MSGEPIAWPLDPETRSRDCTAGTPATLADGAEWLLADGGLGNDLDEARDRMFDQVILTGQVEADDVRRVALVLLLANYDLELEEAVSLVAGVGADSLARPVFEALFGPKDGPASYSDWAASALWANGIDPDAHPSRMRRLILRHLVASGRAIPSEDFCDATTAADQRSGLLARVAKARPADG